MQVFSLPEYLTPDAPNKDLQLVDYQAAQESTKQQISLTHNAISFLQEGNKEVISDTLPIAIGNQHFLMMKAGHCLMTEKFSSATARYRSVLLFFSNETLFRFTRKHQIRLQKNPTDQSTYAFAYDSFITSFVRSLEGLVHLKASIREKLLEIKFEELMLYLTDQQGPNFLSSLLAHANAPSFRLLSVVEHNKHNKLTLKELAFLANMSVSTFKRAFERHFEEPPSQWFQNKRLEYAAVLLKNESKRPSDIYEDAGYESLSNFIQAFKNKYGVTPKQYQLA